jgi:hypothetical protein
LPHLELPIVNAFCFALDSASTVVIVGYCIVAFIAAFRSGRATEAHALVAKGVLLGMSIKLVGACLKTIELQTWNQIGLFMVILALRTILKRFFQMEAKIGAPNDGRQTPHPGFLRR